MPRDPNTVPTYQILRFVGIKAGFRYMLLILVFYSTNVLFYMLFNRYPNTESLTEGDFKGIGKLIEHPIPVYPSGEPNKPLSMQIYLTAEVCYLLYEYIPYNTPCSNV